MTGPLLSLRGIAKRFGRVQALADVDLAVAPGEVHAVLGENGAGKSTLMNVIYGLVTPDAGTLTIDGRAQRLRSARDARRAGIGMVHQEFALVDALSVAENLALALAPDGAWRWRPRAVAHAAERLAAAIGLELAPPDARVGSLPVGARQRIEIVKALAGRTRLLILDEPTAVLTPAEVEQLLAVLDRLRRDGTAVLFITHKLPEVLALADRITVLRHGRVVATVARAATDAAALARLMVGPLAPSPPGRPVPDAGAAACLELDGIRVAAADGSAALDGVTLRLAAGETLGIAGVDGNGQEELFELLAGLRRAEHGHLAIAGRPVRDLAPAALLAAGVAWIPPDRLRQGVVAPLSIAENAQLSAPLLRAISRWRLDPAAMQLAARALVDGFAIRAPDLDAPAASLSGGNLQKLIVARALAHRPRLLIAVSPTRGLDLAAARAVYDALDAARAGGAAVLLISTDLDEVVACADRIAVLYRGRLSAPLSRPFPLARLGAMLAGSEAA